MNSKYVDLGEDRCTGCGTCANACPKNCITMEANEHGFLMPQINTEQCISCGICKYKCPQLKSLDIGLYGAEEPETYAAQSLDIDIRYNSTSGGIFSELARWIIYQGGYVVGVIYGEGNEIYHYVTNKETDIQNMRQSKYAQSDKRLVYPQVRELLLKHKTVLFVGAPCEVAGLLAYLGKRYDTLLILDFICLGANSPLVYKKYLGYLTKKYNSDIERVWFKYKKFGWEQFATRVEFSNNRVYIGDRYRDLYMRGYIQKSLYLRTCCYDCKYKSFPRLSDITVGDFWGVSKVFPDIDRSYGVSAVCVNTEKGRGAIATIADRLLLRQCEMKDIAAQNSNISKSTAVAVDNTVFYNDLEKLGFRKAVLAHTKEPCIVRIKRRLKFYIRVIKFKRNKCGGL